MFGASRSVFTNFPAYPTARSLWPAAPCSRWLAANRTKSLQPALHAGPSEGQYGPLPFMHRRAVGMDSAMNSRFWIALTLEINLTAVNCWANALASTKALIFTCSQEIILTQIYCR
jgi:hypothetical protein